MRIEDLEQRQLIPGTKVRFVHSDRMTIAHWHFEPGTDLPEHSHPHEQISVMLQGRMRLTVGDEIQEIGPGDIWYAPANVPHGGELLVGFNAAEYERLLG